MTPLHTHDRYLTESRNYCEAVSARKLTYYRYQVLLNFYVTLFVTHPTRIFRLFYNLLTGKESTKLDGFMQETKRKFLLSLKNLFRPRRRRTGAAPAASH